MDHVIVWKGTFCGYHSILHVWKIFFRGGNDFMRFLNLFQFVHHRFMYDLSLSIACPTPNRSCNCVKRNIPLIWSYTIIPMRSFAHVVTVVREYKPSVTSWPQLRSPACLIGIALWRSLWSRFEIRLKKITEDSSSCRPPTWQLSSKVQHFLRLSL